MLPRLPQEPAVQSAPVSRLVMSWWDREVHIWHINQSSKPSLESTESETEEFSHTHSRKLVAKVLIKGEANISCASISHDGNLLAISTLAEVKVFELQSHQSAQGLALRVSKIRAPRNISSRGAKLVQFSPDGHWLAITRTDNHIITARVLGSDKQSISSFHVLPRVSRLARIDRKIEKHVLLGGLGAYNRTVTRMAFSSDSRILAVSDLAGYIDTWVLDGQQDPLQTPIQASAEEESAGDDASSASSTDEYDSENEAENSTIVLGQRWKRNPSASLLPNLSAAAVVLSFRPAKDIDAKNDSIPHLTRNKSRAYSQDPLRGEYRLLVVTATSMVHEFEVMNGRLTEWSRTNSTTKFPLEFQNLKDQTMGCLWDVGEKERLWLYGSNWLWMFDLSRDFSSNEDHSLTNGHAQIKREHTFTNGDANGTMSTIEGTKSNRKRKRGRGTGAGNKVPDSELGTGMSRKMQLITFDNGSETREEVDLENRQDTSEMDLDESDDDNALERFQRGEDADSVLLNRDGMSLEGRDDDDGPPLWWHSYKYRPIMGVVPLIGTDKQGIEVALVERPMWENDLPPRYYGQEWGKPGL